MIASPVQRLEWAYCPLNHQASYATVESVYASPQRSKAIQDIPKHRLASVFMAMALGRVFSDSNRTASDRLFDAASALLTDPDHHFLVQPTLASIETLHMMVSYLFAVGRARSTRAAWSLLGTSVRLACSMGLHKDPSSWGITEKEKGIRQRLWWELFSYDVL